MSNPCSKSWKQGLNDKLNCIPYFIYTLPSNRLKIEEYYFLAKKENNTCNCINIGNWVCEPAICVKGYLINKFGIDVTRIIGNGDYLTYEDGYAYFIGRDIKRCRYVMARELGLDCIHSKYIVHHIDLNKLNDNIANLFLVYNQALHNKIHVTLYDKLNNHKSISFEQILEYTNSYMNDELKLAENNLKKQSIIDYLKLLDTLAVVRNTSVVFNN